MLTIGSGHLLRRKLRQEFPGGDVLLIVPPFAAVDRPSLALHLLQALAAVEDFRAHVLYANMLFAAQFGEVLYDTLCYLPTGLLIGERLFAPTAFGTEVVDSQDALRAALVDHRPSNRHDHDAIVETVMAVAPRVAYWVTEVAEAIAGLSYGVFGCTTTFEQTAASWALLAQVKRGRQDAVTILGGANCDGEMGHGLLALGGGPDFIFSGESERTFPQFLRQYRAGALPEARLIKGTVCDDLDALPPPRYKEYYSQLKRWLPDSSLVSSGAILLPYESSRGCWWGEKHHCTFCGLNGSDMRFREKSADKVVAELKELMCEHPIRQVCMTDNIMPHRYFATLIPKLVEARLQVEIFYEQKANLSLEKVRALHDAGVRRIQPGIEALSTSLLKLMKKGVSARQNIALLRYARALGLRLNWNILYAFPGDDEVSYQETLALLPLLSHLEPPSGCFPLSIERFSPYFESPSAYGIADMKPSDAYRDVFPEHAKLDQIAYHFTAEYPTAARRQPGLVDALRDEVTAWIKAWQCDDAVPTLWVTPVADELFLLVDTRCANREQVQFITEAQAAAALCEHRHKTSDVEWGLTRGVSVAVDGVYSPLAVASVDVLSAFESRLAASINQGYRNDSVGGKVRLPIV